MINYMFPYAFSTCESMKNSICVRLGYIEYVQIAPPHNTLVG
jgi:hypothetical protein